MCSTPQRFLDEVARRYLQGSQILKTTKQPILLRGSTEYEIQYNGIRTLVFSVLLHISGILVQPLAATLKDTVGE